MSYIYVLNSLNNIINYQKRKKKKIKFYYSKFLYSILKKIESEFLEKVYIVNKKIIVKLKYIFNNPIIKNIKFISKPSKRIYIKIKELKNTRIEDCIISTNIGILNKKESIKKNIGGEILFSINV